MTSDQKLAYSESVLFRNIVKAQALPYADEVVREDPYGLIPEDPSRSLQYHTARVVVSNRCLSNPDIFAQQNAGSVALMLADPVLADELAVKGAVINLWETLAGGKPPPPPPGGMTATARGPDLGYLPPGGLAPPSVPPGVGA